MCNKQPVFWVSTFKRNFDEIINFPDILGGQLLVLNSENANEKVAKIWSQKDIERKCGICFLMCSQTEK